MTVPVDDCRRNYPCLLAFVCGIVGVTLLLAGGAALVTSASAKLFGAVSGDAPLTGDAVAIAPQLGYVLIFPPAMWALSLSIATHTWQMWTTGFWPGWLRWLSVFTAIMLLLAAALFNPIIMLPVWVGAVSAYVFHRPSQSPKSSG